MERPRYRVTVDLVLSQKTNLGYFHKLLEKFCDGQEVTGFTLRECRELLKPNEPHHERDRGA
jgi:hypothetical protein